MKRLFMKLWMNLHALFQQSKYRKFACLTLVLLSAGMGIYHIPGVNNYIIRKSALSRLANSAKLRSALKIEQSDPEKSYELLQQAADSGYPLALITLGRYHITGNEELGIERNFKKGIEFMEKAFDRYTIESNMYNTKESKTRFQDHAPLFYIGYAYFEGDKFLFRNTEKGLKYLKKAAKAGSYSACHHLGYAYLHGEYGISKDIPQALKFLQIAADNGVAKSQMLLGCYYLDYNYGMVEDVEKAIKYLKLAASNIEEPCSLSKNILAEIYLKGLYGIVIDKKKGLALMHQAAELGNHEAQFQLGSFYWKGEHGITADAKKSEKFYQLSANNGHDGAQLILGSSYMYGIKFPKDGLAGMRMLHLAADQDNWEAHHSLGNFYIDGNKWGIQQDIERGIKHLKIAAKNGHPKAQYNIAILYAQGIYVEQDELKAILYLKKSADQGFKDAVALLKKINKKDKR